MGSIRVGGFGWTNGFGLILSPLEGTQPQLEQPCHRLLPSKLCILENKPKLVTTFRIPKSGLAKREEKDSLLMHAPILVVFSLFFLPLSFFLSFSPFFLLLVSYCFVVVGCSPLGLSFSWVPLSGCLPF